MKQTEKMRLHFQYCTLPKWLINLEANLEMALPLELSVERLMCFSRNNK